jgi:hypothetical protein
MNSDCLFPGMQDISFFFTENKIRYAGPLMSLHIPILHES